MFRAFLVALALSASLPAYAQFVLFPRFAFNVSEILLPVLPDANGGYAGIAFDGTNFWISQWLSDRIVTITPDGDFVESFVVPGLSGTKALTWDGSHFWAANASTTLSRIDPVSRTLVGTLSLPATARYASYDPTADGGAGGFWIGDFNSDIRLVSMSGATLLTIPAATVGIENRYGAAIDNSGPDPVLWLFYQGGANNVQLGAIDLPSGTPRSETLDLFPLIPGASSVLAGGMFRTTALADGKSMLLAFAQGTPNALVAIEIGSLIFGDRFEEG
jgi:hypothetical protein